MRRLDDPGSLEVADDRSKFGRRDQQPLPRSLDLAIGQHLDLGSRQHPLGRDLVHEHRRGHRPHARIGHLGRLQRALHLPVLADEPVKTGDRDIERDPLLAPAEPEPAEARPRQELRIDPRQPRPLVGRQVERDLVECLQDFFRRQIVFALHQRLARPPAAIGCEIDRDHAVEAAVERAHHLQRGNHTHVVFRRAATEQNRDCLSCHDPIPRAPFPPAVTARRGSRGGRLVLAEPQFNQSQQIPARIDEQTGGSVSDGILQPRRFGQLGISFSRPSPRQRSTCLHRSGRHPINRRHDHRFTNQRRNRPEL